MNAIGTTLRTEPTTIPARSARRPPAASPRRLYLLVLGWAFTLFSTVRLAAYLPTVWVIVQSGDSSQHSLWTWCTWLGANATMAAWLYESNGQRVCRVVMVSVGNTAMCAGTALVIAVHRGLPSWAF